MTRLFGFIGIGNMGYAMLSGAANVFDKVNLTFTDVNLERLEWVNEQTGVDYCKNNSELIKETKIVILAVKPQYYSNVLTHIKEYITKQHIIISIAPGISVDSLKEQLGEETRIIRAMPNTPALVNTGMTAIAYSKDNYLEEEKKLINEFFTSFGEVVVLEERLMDSVVPIIGSSPAYVFMFIEALADGAVKLGISRQDAYKLVAQTVLGSAKMVLDTKEHPGVLKDQVCSPGGTTIEAVAALEKNGFRNAILEAVNDCYEKCIKLSK
ncbi:pyrroline-5-carboxylate reductase [Natranaerovirga pectinivora]|uniref:Pyrroline-5-carboxylate reductase n=1 Tax=Natranaerovirga pectinivora TaxID=682400 RepID=A0A4R3MMF3_9FIRM|nr:pyrroline-5-carboxylate reductase [Natranaerovirga pectinivora]TCT15025.1 pyrroline-5-carboxylate reductase [Natranaerovirga pectinivora]